MIADENILKPGQQIKAILDEDYAKQLVELRYGFRVKKIKELDAYDDRNYYVSCEDRSSVNNTHVPSVAKSGYVLKIINSLDTRKTGFFEAQDELLIFLNKKGFVCPIPVKQKDGSYYSVETLGPQGQKHLLRLLVFQPGEVLCKVPKTSELLRKIGIFAARLDDAMREFSHPAFDTQTSLWVLTAVPQLRDFYFALENKNDVDFVESIVSSFEKKVLAVIDNLDKGIIHGDLNENNIIASPDGQEIEAIIDFGDSHKSCFIFELAICLCHMITESKSIEMVKHVIQGYRLVRQLNQQERKILKLCVCARFVQSLVLGIYTHQKEPDNQYLVRAHEVQWLFVKKLWVIDDDELMTIWNIKD